MTRVGLVLGAGGIVGQAYHAGVLAALEHDLGWDPRTADVIVGTSAGSVTGTLLSLGVPAHDLAAWAVQAPLSVESADFHDWLQRDRPELPPLSVQYWLRRWRLPSTELLARIARRPWAIRPSVLASTMMPAGEVGLLERADALNDIEEETWPPGLRICATARRDGRRVVFGAKGSPRATLPEAVAASCAIPGYFTPVRIDDAEYLDGGVHSPTNSDILARDRLDLVIVIAPMSSAGGLRAILDAPIRYSVHRRVEKEVRCLREHGVRVVRIEPAEETLGAMRVNMMADDRSDEVVQASFVETGRYTAMPDIAARLAPLVRRSAHRRVDAS